MYKFCEVLKDLIDEKDLSLRKIEKESGISSSQLSRYLKSTIPTLDISIKLANYFGCSLDYLFGLSDDKNCKYKDYDLSKFVSRYLDALKLNKTTHWKFTKANNMSEACLRHWKSGETPSMYSLIVIAQNLDISIDWLIGRD